ncbi:MAG: phage tail tip lysozyme [Candidatus Saccharibacteria bacterium]
MKQMFSRLVVMRLGIVSCLVSLAIAPVAGAFDDKYDPDFYGSNDILYYNPEATCYGGAPSSGGGATGDVALVKSATLEQIFTLLINGGMTNVQAAAVMGNMYAESSFNSDKHEVGNDIGYGLVQWSFGRRIKLEAASMAQHVAVSDVGFQIGFLLGEYNSSYKSAMDGTAFSQGTDVSKATETWMTKFEVPAMDPANDPAALNSKRIPAALKIYDFYKDLKPAAGAVTTTSSGGVVASTTDCSTSATTTNGAVAGSIVETALNLALTSPATQGMTSKSDARDTYQVAKEKYNPGPAWSDCGGFVATVMISSGVDPSYPSVGTTVMASYVRAHPTKYKIIENPTTTAGPSQLLPGDILISSGHTEIYTGKSGFPIVDASLNDRVPAVATAGSLQWMLSSGAFAARVISTPTP